MEIEKEKTITAWKEALRVIENEGILTNTDGKLGKEVTNLAITITKPSEDITSPIKALKEIKTWAYPELEDLEDAFFRKEASNTCHYNYGERIFNHAHAKDQVDGFVIPLLQKNPQSRKAVITIHNPCQDSNPENKEIPAITSIQFKVQQGRLNATAIIRSSDVLIGWPANAYQIFLLQKHISEKLNLAQGSITTISNCAQVYEDAKQEFQTQKGSLFL